MPYKSQSQNIKIAHLPLTRHLPPSCSFHPNPPAPAVPAVPQSGVLNLSPRTPLLRGPIEVYTAIFPVSHAFSRNVRVAAVEAGVLRVVRSLLIIILLVATLLLLTSFPARVGPKGSGTKSLGKPNKVKLDGLPKNKKSATSYGGGGGQEAPISPGLPFAGRIVGGGNRQGVYGNRYAILSMRLSTERCLSGANMLLYARLQYIWKWLPWSLCSTWRLGIRLPVLLLASSLVRHREWPECIPVRLRRGALGDSITFVDPLFLTRIAAVWPPR